MTSRKIKESIVSVLRESAAGLSASGIQRRTKINRTTVVKYLQVLWAERQIKFRREGMAKIWSISDSPLISMFSVDAELSEDKNYTKDLFNTFGDIGIAILDKECRFVWINGTLSSWVGGLEELKGKTCHEIYRIGEDTPICPAKLAETTGKSLKDKIDLVTTSGKLLDVELVTSPIKDKTGKIIGILQTMKDLTDRRILQEKISEYTGNLEQKIDERTRMLATLTGVSYAASHSIELNDVLRDVLKEIMYLLHLSVGMIFLVNTQEGSLELSMHQGISAEFRDEYLRKPLNIGEGIIGSIAKTGEPVYIRDNSSSRPEVARMAAKKEGLRSFMGVPIKSKGSILGVMALASRGKHIFKASDIDLVVAIGNQMGVAIDNAYLFNRTKESEKKYKSLLQALPDAVALLQMDGTVIEASTRVADLFGLDSPSEMIGKSAFEFVSPEHRDWAGSNFEKAIKDGFLSEIEYKLLKKGGDYFIGETNGVRINDSSGNPLGILTTIRDVTERKRIQKEIETSQRFLQSVIDGVSEPIRVIGTDYRIKLMNAASCEDSQSKGASKGMFCYNVSHKRDTPCNGEFHRCPVDEVVEKRKPVTIVHKHCEPANGEERTIEIIASPFFGTDGKLEGVIELSRDITDRDKYYENKNLLESIAENTQDAIVAIDNKYLITYWNRAAEKFFGYKKEEVLGNDIKNNLFWVPKENNSEIQALLKSVDEKQFRSIKTEWVSNTGEKIPVLISLSPVLDQNKKWSGFSAILKDLRSAG